MKTIYDVIMEAQADGYQGVKLIWRFDDLESVYAAKLEAEKRTEAIDDGRDWVVVDVVEWTDLEDS